MQYLYEHVLFGVLGGALDHATNLGDICNRINNEQINAYDSEPPDTLIQ